MGQPTVPASLRAIEERELSLSPSWWGEDLLGASPTEGCFKRAGGHEFVLRAPEYGFLPVIFTIRFVTSRMPTQ